MSIAATALIDSVIRREAGKLRWFSLLSLSHSFVGIKYCCDVEIKNREKVLCQFIL